MADSDRLPPNVPPNAWECQLCSDSYVGTIYSAAGVEPVCFSCSCYIEGKKVVSDGGSTAYYRLPEHASELRHLISHKGMSKSRGDVFKACYRLGEKDGAEIFYDLKKMKFFVEDLIEMYERGERL